MGADGTLNALVKPRPNNVQLHLQLCPRPVPNIPLTISTAVSYSTGLYFYFCKFLSTPSVNKFLV